MHPRNGHVVRPLLDCRRAELRAWLRRARRSPFVEDETNDDVSIPRNRVRAELLPLLEARFNPAIVDVLADEAELAREAWQWMEAAADELERRASVERDGRTLRARSTDARCAPRRGAAARRALAGDEPRSPDGRPIAFGHVDAALRLMRWRRRSRSTLRASAWNASARSSS